MGRCLYLKGALVSLSLWLAVIMLRTEIYRGQISLLSTRRATKADVKCKAAFWGQQGLLKQFLFRFCLRPSITIVPSWDRERGLEESAVLFRCRQLPSLSPSLPFAFLLPLFLSYLFNCSETYLSYLGVTDLSTPTPPNYDWYAHGITVNTFIDVKDIIDSLGLRSTIPGSHTVMLMCKVMWMQM